MTARRIPISLILVMVLVLTLSLTVLETQGQTGGLLAYNTSVSATLSPQFPLGIYTFSGTAGDLVTVHVASVNGVLDPAVSVVGPDQQAAASNNDYAFGPSPRDAFVSVLLTRTGVYSILVTGANGTSGDYLLRLNGRLPVQARELRFGEAVEVDIPPFPQPQYFWFDAGDCPTTLTITDLTAGEPLTFPFTAIVRDQDGIRIAMLQGGRELEDTVTVMPRSGRYEVEILSADPLASGSILLEVGCGENAPMCRVGRRPLLPLIPARPRVTLTPQPGQQSTPPAGPTVTPGPSLTPGGPTVTPGPTSTPTPTATNPPPGEPFCGDGVVQPELFEQCDPPNGTTCDLECQTIAQPFCGDGIVQPERGEQCDPANGVDCDTQCQKIEPEPRCGDGIVQADRGEQCDPPNTLDCTASCKIYVPFCGDGIVQPEIGEQCDPPNGDNCDLQCQMIQQPQPFCGDGIVQPEIGEQCDPPNGTSCDNQCQPIVVQQAFCGDGIVQPEIGEQCDPPDGIFCSQPSDPAGACLLIPQ